MNIDDIPTFRDDELSRCSSKTPVLSSKHVTSCDMALPLAAP